MTIAKPILYQNMSKYQLASRPGHRASEHLFVLKSIMIDYEEKNKPILFASYDLRKMFDSEKLTDCMGEIYNSNIKGKVYRMIYKMNEDMSVKVNTPVGVTESAKVGDIVTQGGVDAGILSAVNIDNGMNDAFEDVESDVKYVDLEVKFQIYMDDIGKLSESVEAAQDANKRIERLMESKLLDLNLKKTNFMVIGKKKCTKQLRKKLERNPLMIYDTIMREVNKIQFLGEEICQTHEESVHQTIIKRIGIAKKAIFEIKKYAQ